MAKLGDGGEYNPMTSPTQRAGAGVRRWALNFSPYRVARMIEHALGQFVSYDDYAALQARIAELEARNAASERDAGRYAVIRSAITGGNAAAYAHFRAMPKPETPDDMDALCDAAIDAHAQGQK